MKIYCAATVALVAALGSAAPAAAGGDEGLGVAAAVLQRVSAALGRQADATFTFDAARADWRLVCGRPQEPTGAPFDLARSSLAESEYGADFCALVRLGDAGAEVVEFDIGSTDMPAVDWVEKHGLPADILTDP